MSKTSDKKNKNYGTYLVGLGLGTALSWLLADALGADIPEHVAYKMWGIGIGIWIIGVIIENREKSSRKK